MPGKAGESSEFSLGLLAVRAESQALCFLFGSCSPALPTQVAPSFSHAHHHILAHWLFPELSGLSGCGIYTHDPKEAPQHSEIPWEETGIAAGIETTQQDIPNLLFCQTKQQVTGDGATPASQPDRGILLLSTLLMTIGGISDSAYPQNQGSSQQGSEKV